MAEVIQEDMTCRLWLEYIAEVLSWTVQEIESGPDGFVYFLRSGEFVKIGRSTRLDMRIRTLRIQLPFPIRIINAFPCEDSRKAEKHFHEHYEPFRSNGEWFKLDDRIDETVLSRIKYMSEPRGEYIFGLAARNYKIPAALQTNERWSKAFLEADAVLEAR